MRISETVSKRFGFSPNESTSFCETQQADNVKIENNNKMQSAFFILNAVGFFIRISSFIYKTFEMGCFVGDFIKNDLNFYIQVIKIIYFFGFLKNLGFLSSIQIKAPTSRTTSTPRMMIQ